MPWCSCYQAYAYGASPPGQMSSSSRSVSSVNLNSGAGQAPGQLVCWRYRANHSPYLQGEALP